MQVPADADTTLDKTVDTDANESKSEETAENGFEQSVDDGLDATDDDPSKANETLENDEERQQSTNDKSMSRSGRVIKRTKYLHDEIEDSPSAPKKKRLSENSVTRTKRGDESDGKFDQMGDEMLLNFLHRSREVVGRR